jgi:hypothetical protein
MVTGGAADRIDGAAIVVIGEHQREGRHAQTAACRACAICQCILDLFPMATLERDGRALVELYVAADTLRRHLEHYEAWKEAIYSHRTGELDPTFWIYSALHDPLQRDDRRNKLDLLPWLLGGLQTILQETTQQWGCDLEATLRRGSPRDEASRLLERILRRGGFTVAECADILGRKSRETMKGLNRRRAHPSKPPRKAPKLRAKPNARAKKPTSR